MNAQANQQHVTPYQAFGEQDAMGSLGASIAATKRAQDIQQQPVQPMHQQQPVQPMAQPPMQQPQPQQPVMPQPPVQQPAQPPVQPQQPITNDPQQPQAVTPPADANVVDEHKAPVIDKVEGDDSGAGELGTAPTEPTEPTEPVKKPFEETPKTEVEFDQALAELEKELGLADDKKPVETADENQESDTETPDSDEVVKKSLEREGKFIKIINELDSTNRKSLKKVGELEVERDNANAQKEYYMKQAQEYYEELRANEFDRSKFTVTDKAKNFVHYYNEYSEDKDNSQAKNAALREAIKIAGEITGRDLTPYLMDYFSQGSAVPLGEERGSTGVPNPVNLQPGRHRSAEDAKRSAVGSALFNM